MQFADILKGADAEGKEKHVPTIEIIQEHAGEKVNLVHVVVGKETPHPNTAEHYIAWVEVFGVKKEGGQVVTLGRSAFAPAMTAPNISFHTPVDEFKAICALSYCNIHGLWQNIIEI